MKISLSGAQCTGKTTLIKQIEDDKAFSAFRIIKEVVRTIKERKGPNFEFNKSSDFESQDLILTEHHRNVLLYDTFITDRGSVDAFVYATKNYLDGLFTFKEWKHFETIFKNTYPRYDSIFYLPVGLIAMESDGIRSTDIEYQTEIDNLFRWVFEEYDIEHVILNDPLEDRFAVFKGMLLPSQCCADDECTKHHAS